MFRMIVREFFLKIVYTVSIYHNIKLKSRVPPISEDLVLKVNVSEIMPMP